MVNFERLVIEELLFEAEGQPTNKGVDNEEIADNTSTKEVNGKSAETNTVISWKKWFDQNKVKEEFKTLWNSKNYEAKYLAPFPSDQELNNIARGVEEDVRSTGFNKLAPYIVKYMPIIEFFSQLRNSTEKNKGLSQDLQEIWNKFEIEFKKFTGNPFDYNITQGGFAATLKGIYLSKAPSAAATIRIEQLANLNILDAILKLIAARKASSNLITRLDKKILMRDSSDFVKKLILEFYDFGTANTQTIDQVVNQVKNPNVKKVLKKLTNADFIKNIPIIQKKIPVNFFALYDDLTPSKIISVAEAAYAYYVLESKRLGIALDDSKKMEGYHAFVQNEPLVNQNGKTIFDFQKFSNIARESFRTFDELYNDISRLILEDPDMKDNVERATEREYPNTAKGQKEARAETEQQTNNEETPENATPEPVDGGYIIKNIDKNSDLYARLLELAEYIKIGKSTDLLGGLAQIAQAGSALTSITNK